MPELVTIPISVFDFEVGYERPEFKLWMDRAKVVQGVFDALDPWGLVSTMSKASPPERRPSRVSPSSFRLSGCRFSLVLLHANLLGRTLARS